MTENQHHTDDMKKNGAGDRITVAVYGEEDVLPQFSALYAHLDFRHYVSELDISSLRIKRRRQAERELRALSIALWGLALQRSFPEQAESFFAAFREKSVELNGNGDEAAYLKARVGIYTDLLKEKKDADFMPVAAYLTEVLALSAADTARLKASLITRNLYTLIFDKLV